MNVFPSRYPGKQVLPCHHITPVLPGRRGKGGAESVLPMANIGLKIGSKGGTMNVRTVYVCHALSCAVRAYILLEE